jgi:LPS-assembly protein
VVKGLKILIILISFSFGIEVFSERLYRDPLGNIIAQGDVEVHYGEFVIKADRMTYDPESKEVHAFGNVYIRKRDGTFEVKGSQALLNTETGKGHFLDAEGRFRAFYFSAKRVDRIEEETYYIIDGDVTTCPPTKKDLKVCFWKAAITEKHVFAFSNQLKLFNIPVAYSPLILFPVGERRSGLLPPMIGSNTYNTFIYRQPLFLALSMDKDMTFTLDYRDIQAKGIWLEYRQAFSKERIFYTRLKYYREPVPRGEWWKGREPETFRIDRYRLELQTSLGGLRVGLDVPSDPYFFEDVYFEENLRRLPFTLSHISYSKMERDYLFTFTLRNYFDLTSPNNRQTLNILPEFGFYSRPKKIGFFYLNLTSTFTNFFREKGLRAQRIIFSPELEAPYGVLGLQNYSRLRLVNNFYYTNQNFSDNTVNTFIFENRTPFFFEKTLGEFSFNSTFELIYSYSPRNFLNPQFDSYDVVVKENNAKMRMVSMFSFADKKISSLFLEGGYNFLRSYRFPTDSALIEKEVLPLRTILSFYPLRWLSLSYDSTYDLNLDINARSVSTVRIGGGKNFLSLSYATSRNSKDVRITDQYSLNLGIDFKGFILGVSGSYDTISERLLYGKGFLGIRGPCYYFKVDYRRTFYQNLGDYINEIFVVFNIFNLRDFKLPLRRR